MADIGYFVHNMHKYDFEKPSGDIGQSMSREMLELYILLVNCIPVLCWKTRANSDGQTNDNTFFVGISTPEGSIKLCVDNEYWDEFACVEYERFPDDESLSEDICGSLASLKPWMNRHMRYSINESMTESIPISTLHRLYSNYNRIFEL